MKKANPYLHDLGFYLILQFTADRPISSLGICRLDLLLLFVAAAVAAVVVSKANLRDGYRGIMFLAIWKKTKQLHSW